MLLRRSILASLAIVATVLTACDDQPPVRVATAPVSTTTTSTTVITTTTSTTTTTIKIAAAREVPRQRKRVGPIHPALLPSRAAAPYPTPVMRASLVPFFRCVIHHESATAGVYTAVQPGGRYQGAYQADANFVRSYAPASVRHYADSGDWWRMPPEDQDRMAMNGYDARGTRPWDGATDAAGACSRLAP